MARTAKKKMKTFHSAFLPYSQGHPEIEKIKPMRRRLRDLSKSEDFHWATKSCRKRKMHLTENSDNFYATLKT